MKNMWKLSSAALVVACAIGPAFGGLGDGRQGGLSVPVAAGLLGLEAEFPGVQAQAAGGRLSLLYGRPMTAGGAPLEAADAFVERYAVLFGAAPAELSLERETEVTQGLKTIAVYEQNVEGVRVERGRLRVLVMNDFDGSRVVLASGRLATKPEGGFPAMRLTAADAFEVVAKNPAWGAMQEFDREELVVYIGEGDEAEPRAAARAWKFVGSGFGLDGLRMRYVFFVDAATGELLFARNEIHHGSADVGGTVFGLGSPGLEPDIASNPPVPIAMPEIRVDLTGGLSGLTDRAGLFLINNNVPGSLVATANVLNGSWVRVVNAAGSSIGATANVTAPGVVDLLLNPTPTEFTTAQVNAFVQQNRARAYFRDRAPSFSALDTVVPANVNVASTCNASYDGIINETNYFNASAPGTAGGCNNTAYASVVAHEYGHHIVNRLGLAQGAFGEGFADTISMMMFDDPIIGRNFRFDGSIVRNPETANRQYPCTSTSSHTCGLILGGTVWEMRRNFGAFYGEPLGLELARQLHVDWALVTQGGIGFNSAHPTTAIEMLTVDDNDGNLENGTPNYARICDAFAQHGIACPAISALNFEYPDGQPEIASPLGGTTLRVNVTGVTASPEPNAGTLFYRVNGGMFLSIPMESVGLNQYRATFPPGLCGSTIEYYVSVGLVGGGSATSPMDAPLSIFRVVLGTGLIVNVNETVEAESGWQLATTGDTAATGRWVRADPNGTSTNGIAVQPEDDHTQAPGVNCFFTGQGSVGGTVGEADVDAGITTLTSPDFDLAGAVGATLSYWRWYSNSQGAEPNADVFRVQITNNGTTWVPVETVGPTGPQTSGGWFKTEVQVQQFVTPTSTVRLRFIAEDLAGGSLVEAAVDDVRIVSVQCAAPPACPGDANGDQQVNFSDITTVLKNFGGPGPLGDADGNSAVNFMDITTVLSNFLMVCP